jgi:hypothetical protein
MNMASPLLGRVFRSLDRVAVEYCVLRGYDELLTPSVSQQVDLLLRPSDRRRFEVVMEVMGFVRSPALGPRTCRPYVAYDPEDDCWIELQVVETLRYGTPLRCLELPLASALLARRRRRGVAWMAAPEDELLTLLLHCVLDTRRFREGERSRLRALWEELRADAEAQKRLFSLLASRFGSWPMLAVVQGFDLQDWDDLLRQGRRWTRRLLLRQPLAAVRTASFLLLSRLPFLLRRRGTTTVLVSPDRGGRRILAAALAQDPWLRARVVPSRGRVAASWCHAARGWAQALLGWTVVVEHDTIPSQLSPPGRGAGWRPWKPDLVLLLEPSVGVLPPGHDGGVTESVEVQRRSPPFLGVEGAVVDTASGADAVRRDATALIWKRTAALRERPRRASGRNRQAASPMAPGVAPSAGPV